MAFNLEEKLVVGISSRALFDLSYENQIYEQEGVESYRQYQIAHEKECLAPGPGFALVKALLDLNKLPGHEGCIEVIVMSRNSADTSLRVFHSIREYGLDISRAVLAAGASLAPYLSAFHTDLFLSAHEDDVQSAIDSGIAAGIICCDGVRHYQTKTNTSHIKIAFDGDAVLFSDESEMIFQKEGLEAFEENEEQFADTPLKEGPFARLLKMLSKLQEGVPQDEAPIRIALVTSRCAPCHERVIKTLRAWNVRVDEAFFLGGIAKKDVLKAFGAHIFFDDQAVHTIPASEVVPVARVPYKNSA